MSVLHLVHSSSGFVECLTRVGQGDAVLLLEAGVYASLVPVERPENRDVLFYVLGEHLAPRGVAVSRLQPDFVITDFEGFVALTLRHQCTVNWS